MKVYITKYALTVGIEEADAELWDSGMISVKPKASGYVTSYFHRDEWHRTKDDAIARAEVMRRAKIASLRKSIAKLETLTFTEVA